MLARTLNRLALRVEEQIGAAEAERDHLRTILARMSEGVLVMGPDGRAVSANPSFRRLFALRGEVRGRPPLEISRQPQLAQIISDTLADGEGRTAELERELPERRTLLLASDSLGAGRGAVVVARDTTALTRLAAMRRDFVANVSHELKTPLAAIRGYAETLNDGALEDGVTARRFVGRILVQCRRLQALLDDLLVLSRLESVEAPEPRERVDLAAVAERAAELLAGPAAEKGVTIEVEGEPTPAVRGDAESLERLVVNLVDNAIKYNRPGGRAQVKLSAGDESAWLEVSDTGIGIPADSLPRLFERFYRVDKGRSRAEGGTGLGLAIVKHIAQLHGGRVEVESREGKGSTFRVELPLADRR
jgi:two-component system phosphate regulon sensor histidine kinase PhoR